MSEPMDPEKRELLFDLYSQLHLACGRAAAALRLSANWDASEDEMLQRFREEEARAAEIWKRIQQLQGTR